jgi:hypothetical protein
MDEMVNPDASQEEKPEMKKEVRHRQRASTSCTECRRRKQKVCLERFLVADCSRWLMSEV